jgi:hypothetical protein
LQRRALSLTEVAFGASHPEIARRLDILAVTMDRRGRFDEALQRQAVDITEKTLGPDCPETTNRRFNLDVVLTRRGQDGSHA